MKISNKQVNEILEKFYVYSQKLKTRKRFQVLKDQKRDVVDFFNRFVKEVDTNNERGIKVVLNKIYRTRRPTKNFTFYVDGFFGFDGEANGKGIYTSSKHHAAVKHYFCQGSFPHNPIYYFKKLDLYGLLNMLYMFYHN